MVRERGAGCSGRQGCQEMEEGDLFTPPKDGPSTSCFTYTHAHARTHTHSPSSVNSAISPTDQARPCCPLPAASALGRLPGCGVARDGVGALNINSAR